MGKFRKLSSHIFSSIVVKTLKNAHLASGNHRLTVSSHQMHAGKCERVCVYVCVAIRKCRPLENIGVQRSSHKFGTSKFAKEI